MNASRWMMALLLSCGLAACAEEDDTSAADTTEEVSSDTNTAGDTSGDFECRPEAICDDASHVLWYDLAHCQSAEGATCTEEPECEFTNVCSPPLCPLGGEVLDGDTCPQDAGCYTVTNGNVPWTCVVGSPCALGDEAVETCPQDATCYTAQGEGSPVTCLDNDRATCDGGDYVVGDCIEQRFTTGCTEVTSESGDVALCAP